MPDVTPEAATPWQVARRAYGAAVARALGLQPPEVDGIDIGGPEGDPVFAAGWSAAAEAVAAPLRDQIAGIQRGIGERIRDTVTARTGALEDRLRQAEAELAEARASAERWALRAARACHERDEAQEERDAAREELAGLLRSLESLAAEWDDDAHVAAQQGASPFAEVAHAVRTCATDLRQRTGARAALAGDAPRHVPDDGEYPDAEEMASLDDLEPLPGIGERMAEAWRQGLEGGTGG